MSEVIRVILIDDHIHVHQAISETLALSDDIELVAQGSNGIEAIELCRQYIPDLVLMDVVMPRMTGIEATHQILQDNPAIRILALSSFQDRESVQTMLENGAVGYILKDGAADDLEESIRAAFKGKSVFSSEVTELFLKPPPTEGKPDYGLTERELEVLKLMVSGKHYQEIAAALNISYSTVRFHSTNIMTKMKLASRAEVIAVASRHQIV